MRKAVLLIRWPFVSIVAVLAVLTFAGCQSDKTVKEQGNDKAPAQTKSATPATVTAVAATPTPAPAPAVTPTPAPTTGFKPVRIKACLTTSIKDADGNAWLPDQGFTGGDTIERPDIQIANNKSPAIYQSERYSMTAFSYAVPNGKYTVKLHFSETFEGITGPGQRVFSYKVQGQEFKDFDVWVKAGGPLKAYIETVKVEVTNGKLEITFTPNIENPQINGIEILPGS